MNKKFEVFRCDPKCFKVIWSDLKWFQMIPNDLKRSESIQSDPNLEWYEVNRSDCVDRLFDPSPELAANCQEATRSSPSTVDRHSSIFSDQPPVDSAQFWCGSGMPCYGPRIYRLTRLTRSSKNQPKNLPNNQHTKINLSDRPACTAIPIFLHRHSHRMCVIDQLF